MKYWTTQVIAISPLTNKLTEYHGPVVPGNTLTEAESYCQENGLGFCHILGECHGFVDEETGLYISQNITEN